MEEQTIKPRRNDSDEARITIQQFCAIYQLYIRVFKTLKANYGADISDISVIDGNIKSSATGFADNKQAALTNLVECISGKQLRIKTLSSPSPAPLQIVHFFKPYKQEEG